jgi:hypothetical protein
MDGLASVNRCTDGCYPDDVSKCDIKTPVINPIKVPRAQPTRVASMVGRSIDSNGDLKHFFPTTGQRDSSHRNSGLPGRA